MGLRMNKMLSVFRALSDQNRLKVVAALVTQTELCACQIAELLQVTGATTSRHLDILISAGLVDRRKDGRWVYYRLKSDDKDFKPVMAWIKNEFSKSEDIKDCLDSLKKITACDLESFCRKKSK
jgi:DNA-binding transcriptional ArsR family regulator